MGEGESGLGSILWPTRRLEGGLPHLLTHSTSDSTLFGESSAAATGEGSTRRFFKLTHYRRLSRLDHSTQNRHR